MRVLCDKCKSETNHLVISEHEESGECEEDSFAWWETYQIVKCAGCDSISFVKTWIDTDSRNFETGEWEPSITLYPERRPKQRDHTSREEIECAQMFPTKTRRAYREVIRSLSANLPILTAIGLRAIIESICIEKGATKGTLERKIDELASNGLLARAQADILHGLRFMGNFAAHEIEPPKLEELLAALEIAETLLKAIYFLPGLANSIKSGRPVAKPAVGKPAITA